MTSAYQHGETEGAAHRAAAGSIAPRGIAYPAVPALQKKSPEEEEVQMKPVAQLTKPEEEELQMKPVKQLKGKTEEPLLQKREDVSAPAVNNTGMPDRLKTGIEHLSGFSMDDVKVHYNSGKPMQLNALAYAQGTDIHIGPGQERHLPHEAWHVVQQKQGRVRPTIQAKNVAVNDDKGLEKEADVMGEKALQSNGSTVELKPFDPATKITTASNVLQGAFIINGVALLDGTLDTWLNDYAYGRPEIRVVVRGWATNDDHTDDYATDLKALEAAQNAATETIDGSNTIIGHSIGTSNPPNAIAWGSHQVWSAWYFNGLEYQDNKTGGWHANRLALLPGAPTADGVPTRYVEFRRPGAIGRKEVDKMERCIFDLLSGRCWPNAHYDGGYVEITGIPGGIKNRLLNMALESTGIKQRMKEMTNEEKEEAGEGFEKIAWLINKLKTEFLNHE